MDYIAFVASAVALAVAVIALVIALRARTVAPQPAPVAAAVPASLSHEDLRFLLGRIDARRIDRRNHEWKLALSLWAGQLGAAKVIADSDSLRASEFPGGKAIGAVGLAFLVGVHVIYHGWFIRPAHGDDRREARRLEENVGYTAPTATAAGVWSSAFQVLVTLLLALVDLAVWLR